jgi:hypothetical protein
MEAKFPPLADQWVVPLSKLAFFTRLFVQLQSVRRETMAALASGLKGHSPLRRARGFVADKATEPKRKRPNKEAGKIFDLHSARAAIILLALTLEHKKIRLLSRAEEAKRRNFPILRHFNCNYISITEKYFLLKTEYQLITNYNKKLSLI